MLLTFHFDKNTLNITSNSYKLMPLTFHFFHSLQKHKSTSIIQNNEDQTCSISPLLCIDLITTTRSWWLCSGASDWYIGQEAESWFKLPYHDSVPEPVIDTSGKKLRADSNYHIISAMPSTVRGFVFTSEWSYLSLMLTNFSFKLNPFVIIYSKHLLQIIELLLLSLISKFEIFT